jgi:hypothetical protein
VTDTQVRRAYPAAPIEINDFDDPFLVARVMAVACHPHDPQRQNEALVTWAAGINAVNEAVMPNTIDGMLKRSATAAAMQMGLTVEELLTLPHAVEIAQELRRLPGTLEQLVTTRLFNPAGRWFSMARAAYSGNVGTNMIETSWPVVS